MEVWIKAALAQWFPRLLPHEVNQEVAAVSRWAALPDRHLLPLSHPVCRPLRLLPKPPPLLWGWGNVDALTRPAVTVVGTRRASARGRLMARVLGQRLGANGVTVVSGLALGVDGEAHRGALEGGGATVAVLGGGLSDIYPRVHRPLAESIRQGRGLLLSEFPPDLGPRPFHFPRRNRILAALSGATVLVEAGQKSGAHSTLEWALHCHRDVWVVPGEGPGKEGNERWLDEGAAVLRDWRSLLDGDGGVDFPYAQESGPLRAFLQGCGGAQTVESIFGQWGPREGGALLYGAVARGEVVSLGGPWVGWVAD